MASAPSRSATATTTPSTSPVAPSVSRAELSRPDQVARVSPLHSVEPGRKVGQEGLLGRAPT
jgi:hypothetical protein